jgi:hypothetical protein
MRNPYDDSMIHELNAFYITSTGGPDMAYLYDLHCHTKEGSKCSDISVKEMVQLYDIFQKAHIEGEKLGLSVFWGIEYSLTPDIDHPSKASGTDFVILNIDKEWLIKNKDAFRKNPEGLFKNLRDAGCFVIHAHPMFGSELRLFPYSIDAVEVMTGALIILATKTLKPTRKCTD